MYNKFVSFKQNPIRGLQILKNSNVSKMIQANSLLLNFQMKSPCYLVTLSLESSDFQTFLKQYVILVPFGPLIYLHYRMCIR